MNAILNQQDFFTLVINFLFYFVIGFFGALLKDLYDTITNVEPKMRIGRILIGSIWTAFLFLFLDSYILKGKSINVIVFLAFINGIIGFEMFGKVATVKGIIDTLKTLLKLKKSIKIDLSELTSDDKDDKNEQ